MIDTVVATGLGRVRGLDAGGVAAFQGIPYAAAPEGSLRCRAPAPRTGWDGVRDCTEFGPAEMPYVMKIAAATFDPDLSTD